MSNFTKLKKIIQKNFKLLLRSKSSALIIIFGPLILISLIGMAFGNAESYSLQIGTYSDEYNDLTESLLATLKDKNFDVDKKTTSELCINEVKTGESNVCILFPKNLEVKDGVKHDITFHIDYSDINLVYNVIDTLSSKIDLQSKALSKGFAEDVLTRLEQTETVVDNRLVTLGDLTTKTDEIKEQTAKLQEQFASLDLGGSGEGNQSPITGVQQDIDHLRKITYHSLTELGKLVDVINGEINNLRGNKSKVEGYLDTAEREIATYKTDLRATDGKLKDSVGRLHGDLSTVHEKLAAAASVNSNANTDMDKVKEDLETNLAALGALQTDLTGIKELTSSLRVGDAETIVAPITTKIVPVAQESTHFNYLFPTLLVLVVMITGILLSSTLISVEKKSKSYFRNFISPTPDSIFLIGAFLTAFLVILCQLAIFMIISFLFFETTFFAFFGTLLVSIVAVMSLFILLGLFIGVIFKTEETTTLAGITMASILLFFSNTLLPLESMPSFFQTLASLNPFVLSQSLIKEAMFFDLPFRHFLDGFYGMAAYICLLFLASMFSMQWLRHKKVFLPKKTYHLWKTYGFGHGVKGKGSKKQTLVKKQGKTWTLATAAPKLGKILHDSVDASKKYVHDRFGDFHQSKGKGISPGQFAQAQQPRKLDVKFFNDVNEDEVEEVAPATELEQQLLGDIPEGVGQAEMHQAVSGPAKPISNAVLMKLTKPGASLPRVNNAKQSTPATPATVAQARSTPVAPQKPTLTGYGKIEAEIADLKEQLKSL